MGRRSSMRLNMALPLPTLSWVALLRLLKRAPLGLTGVDAASKVCLGCGVQPDTPSFRYTTTLLPPARRCPAGRWRKPPLIPGCAARPLTDSFRVHHVVNQEALQLVLSLDDDLDSFYDLCIDEPPPNCGPDGILRDGDRLLHDRDGASASIMSACSSRFSHSTAGSMYSAVTTALSRGSEDSEEMHYSTASAGSFRAGSCCSSPLSYYHTGSHAADSESVSERANPGAVDLDWPGRPDGSAWPAHSADYNLDGQQSSDFDCAAQQSAGRACGRHDSYVELTAGNGCHGHSGDDHDYPDVHADGMGIVAQTYMSTDPLLDFQASVEELVMCHQLIGQPDRLHTLYCRYIQLNPPCLHPTIALAFFRTLQTLRPDTSIR